MPNDKLTKYLLLDPLAPLDDEQRAELAKRSAESRAKFAALREARRAALVADIADAVIARGAPMTASTLVDYPDAAQLLGISVDALKWRVANGKVPGIVRTGRRVQFRRETLMKIGTRSSSR